MGVRTNGNAGDGNEEGENVCSDGFCPRATSSLGKEHYVGEHLILTHSLRGEGEGDGERERKEKGERGI